MKTMMWCLVSGVALATTAYAGDDEMKHGSGQAELQMMDTDHDGSVSASEHAAGAKKMFEMMDKDGDGIVTADEMSAAHKDMPTAHGSQAQAAQSGNLPQADSSARTSDASGKPMKPMKSSAAKIKEIDTDGLLHAPTGPGLAGEIDFDLIKRKTEAVLT